jgi:hypothetical protein
LFRGEFRSRALAAVIVFSAISLAVPGEALADHPVDLHPLLVRGGSIDVGVFYPDRNLNLRVNGTLAGTNDEIDFNEDLRLKEADEIFAAEIAWKFNENWSSMVQFFRSSNSTRVTLGKDIEWGDIVFGADTGVTTGSDFSLTRLFVGRHLDAGRSFDIGIGGGIHLLDISAFIEGTIVVTGSPLTARATTGAVAPLPNLGAWYKHSLSPRWALKARLDLLSANVGEYDGQLINASIGLNYRIFEHIGAGFSYNYFELDVTVDKSDWRGNIETVYDGFYAYVSVFF